MSTIVGIEGLGRGSGRAIREEMRPDHYLRASYYERWLWSTEVRLLRKGTIAPCEVDGWVGRLLAGEPAPRRIDPAQAERDRAAIAISPLGVAGRRAFVPVTGCGCGAGGMPGTPAVPGTCVEPRAR